jgi:tetratricopeptide (TPR) repeat protein
MPRTLIEVFLSSTAMDLEKHRAAVYEGLRRTGVFHCIRQEDFGPRDAGAVAFCREKAQAADLFIGLVGSRRGWEPDGDNAQRSITQMEHDWAREAGRRRFIWVTPDDFPVASDLRERDALHARQEVFRKRIMDASEHIVSQKAFGSPAQLALEVVSHLLAEVVASDLIKQVRPDLTPQDQAPQKEQVPAVAAAVEKLADDNEIDLLALARNPEGADIAELQAKLAARAEAHEAAGERERKIGAEYWRHAGALAFLHDTRAAMRAYTKATELDPDDAEAWNQLGHLQKRVGELDAAIKSYERALTLGNSSADQAMIAAATGNLGLIYRRRGDLDAAESMHKKALAINEALGGKEGMANQYGNLGLIYQTRGDLDAAEAMHKKSLAIEEALGRKEGMASDYANLGLVCRTRGDLEGACECWRRALQLFQKVGARPQVERMQRLLREAGSAESA